MKGEPTRVTSTVFRDPDLGSPMASRQRRRWAPVRTYASLIGWGARQAIPRPLRRPAYGAFSRLVGADLTEVEGDLADYPTFGEFFARRLRAGARSFPLPPDAIASPADGMIARSTDVTIAASGSVVGGADDLDAVVAKGHRYRLDELLVDPVLADRLAGGWSVTIYLAPADYHRVHAPVAGQVVAYDYVPGTLWPVKPFFARTVTGLFARNERAVIHLETAVGPVAVVLIGAVGVGNLWLAHAPEPLDRAWRTSREPRRVELARPVDVARGDELGAFLLGSTVVAVFPRGAVAPEVPPPGSAVRCGQRLGRVIAAGGLG